MNAPVTQSDPPRGYFSVWQRLMRGYGPLAVLVNRTSASASEIFAAAKKFVGRQ